MVILEFKERLKSLRKERKLTQSALGSILNYGYTAISNYESGRNEPSITDLKKIAEFFDVSMDYLLCVNDLMLKGTTLNNSTSSRTYTQCLITIKGSCWMISCVGCLKDKLSHCPIQSNSLKLHKKPYHINPNLQTTDYYNKKGKKLAFLLRFFKRPL